MSARTPASPVGASRIRSRAPPATMKSSPAALPAHWWSCLPKCRRGQARQSLRTAPSPRTPPKTSQPRARGWLVFGGVLGLGAVLRLCRAWPRRHLGRQDHQWAGNAAGEDFMVAGGARLRIREAPTGDAGVLADMDAYVRQSHPT